MTYQELWNKLPDLTSEQLSCDVTVRDEEVDEYYPIKHFGFAGGNQSVLDIGHPILVHP